MPLAPRFVIWYESSSSAPRRTDSSLLMIRAATFLSANRSGCASGAFQVDVKLLPVAHPAVAATSIGIRTLAARDMRFSPLDRPTL